MSTSQQFSLLFSVPLPPSLSRSLHLSLFCQHRAAPFCMIEEAAEKKSLPCDQWPKPVSHLCHHQARKDKSWFLNSRPRLPPPPPPPPPSPTYPHSCTESLGITQPWGHSRGVVKMLHGLFVSANRGGSVSFRRRLTRLSDRPSDCLNMSLSSKEHTQFDF